MNFNNRKIELFQYEFGAICSRLDSWSSFAFKSNPVTLMNFQLISAVEIQEFE